MAKHFLFDVGPAKVTTGRRSAGAPKASGCAACGLHVACKSGRMEPYGEGKRSIFILGKAPGTNDDDAGRPFAGSSGKFQEDLLSESGINMDRDCWLSNAVQCHPGTAKVSDSHIRLCRPRVMKQIHDRKPELILAMGGEAIKSVFAGQSSKGAMAMRGRVIPAREFDCWCGCPLHPSFIIRNGERSDEIELWRRDLKTALEVLG